MSTLLNTKHLINGTFAEGQSASEEKITNKYSQEEIATIQLIDDAQMEEVISSSVKGFETYKSWSAGKRSKHLAALKQKLEERKEDFIELIAKEAGKPKSYATGEVMRCLVTLETAVREAIQFDGEVVPMDFGKGEGKTAFTKRFPVGPIAAISPFNFPLNLALHKLAPALAAGCSIILKPSPFAPLTAFAFAKLIKEVGYPDGVVNVILANNEVAEKMITDERMKLFSFTGSPKVGWMLKQKAGKKKVTLELGGNAAVVVDEDANLQEAAETIATGAFLYAGQICISTQRILVVETVFEAFKTLLVKEIEKLKLGNPLEKDISVGPIISKDHLQRIENWVKEAVEDGARIICGGEVADVQHSLFAPTLLTNTQHGMKVCDEEVFGPVATLESYPTFEAAITEANNTRFGLQAGVYTNRIDQMKYAFENLDVGGVLINNIPGFRIDSMPYGGIKDSGLGREGIKYAMEDMTESKLIVY